MKNSTLSHALFLGTLFALGGTGAGCGGPTGTSDSGPDVSDTGSAPHDATADASSDTGPDATPDAGIDAAPEAGPDAAPEAGPDAAPEAGPDAAPEASTDAGPEASTDAGPMETSTMVLGGASAGNTSMDECPPGQYVIGVRGGPSPGFYGDALTQYSTQCGNVAITGSGASRTVTITPGVLLPPTGGRGTRAASAVATAMCGAGEVVVGIQGTTQMVTLPPTIVVAGSITLRCAPLTVDPTSGALVRGATVVRSTVGQVFPTAAGPYDCPAGTLSAGATVYWGEVANGVSLRCRAITP